MPAGVIAVVRAASPGECRTIVRGLVRAAVPAIELTMTVPDAVTIIGEFADGGVAVTVIANHLVVGLPSNDVRILTIVPRHFINDDLGVPAQRWTVITAMQPHAGIDRLTLVVQRQEQGARPGLQRLRWIGG